VLCVAAIVAVVIPAPRPVQIAAVIVIGSPLANAVTLLWAELAIEQRRRDPDR
jgi:hypothetical protein